MTKVLVVEDEALIAGDIQRTLVRLGYEVPTVAGTGQKALDLTEQLRPSLVLMDIKLRGAMDGIEAAAEIQARFATPIIYLTSHSDEATLSRAKTTNPHGYLVKPFSDRELRTAIEVALHRHALVSRLVARERWFSTTLRSIGDAVIATDERGTVTFLNVVAERLTGWGQEAVGRPLFEVFAVVDASGRAMASLAREGSFTMKLPPTLGLVVRDGRQVPIEDAASLIVDDASAVLGRVVVFRDITERLRLEARVAQAERLASLGTMIAGVAHEINNPLAYVINNVEFSLAGVFRALAILDDATTGAAAREGARRELAVLKDALRDAGEGAERIRLVVDELRKFCDGGTPTARVLELPSVLEFAIKMTAHAVSHHAAVRREFGATPPVKANDGALGQVFTNLLINAAQAIGGGRAEGNEIVVSTHTDGEGRAVVEVRDTGPGIAPDVLSRLFDPFFTTKPVGSGMGLGLTICQNIIGGLGGFITVESPPGGGALFRVTLPPATGDALLDPSQPPPAATNRRGAVLVIDDEIAITRVVSRLLDPEHDVTTMSDGRDAVAAIASGATFDVIFCDLMMPSFSGGEVYERILAINAEQARRIVFMTGGAFLRKSSDVLPNPANAQLHKPFTSAAIQAVVRNYVARADSA